MSGDMLWPAAVWPTETRAGYVVRNMLGDRWFFDADPDVAPEDSALEQATNYLLDTGGRLFEVQVLIRVTGATLLDTQEPEPCDDCQGRGIVTVPNEGSDLYPCTPCVTCGGTGRLR